MKSHGRLRRYRKFSPVLGCLVVLLGIVSALVAHAASLPQVAELHSDDVFFPGGGGAHSFAFGSAVAISGDGNTMVVGAGASGSITVDDGTVLSPHSTSYRVDFGAIHIFTKQGDGWTEAGLISAPDGTQGFDSFGAETGFGASVAVNYDGSVIAAGGPQADSTTFNCGGCFLFGPNGGGAVYVYVRPQGGWTDNLPFSAKLTNSDGHFDDELGSSVAISNDGTIVVAAAPLAGFLSGSEVGEAYLYVQPPGGWGVQNHLYEMTKFNNPDSSRGFASSIAISGDGRVVVIPSAYGPPKAYIYNEGPNGWQAPVGGFYSAITNLLPSDGAPDDNFGTSVALNGDGTLIVLGAPSGLSPLSGQSKAYVYFDAYGWSASSANTEAQQLSIRNASVCSQFGTSVSVTPDGTTILVGDSNQGAPINNSCIDFNGLALGTGAAYIFTQASCGALCPPGPDYINTGELTPLDSSAGNRFGAAVAISSAGDELLVGAPYKLHDFESLSLRASPAGNAYVFAPVPLAALSSSSLNFSAQPVGTTSAPQKVTLKNNGSKPLSVTVEGLGPSFQFQSGTPNCLGLSPLGPGASCDEYLIFAPTAAGPVSGNLSFQDNSGNVPGTQQTVSLSGTGILADTTTTITADSPNPAVVGQTITVNFKVGWGTNTFNPYGAVTVSASTGESCGGFAVVDNCTLSFLTYGTRTLTATYVGDSHFNGSTSMSVTQNVGDFSIAASPTGITIPIGSSGPAQITIGSLGGFNFPVSLAASGVPLGVSASVLPSPVTPPSGGSISSTLGVSLGPSVKPGTFSLTASGTFGSLMHSAAVGVTVIATPGSTTNVINQVLIGGCIDNSGVANALTSKLAAAESALNAGNPQVAFNILTALLYQLQTQSGEHISTSCTIGGVTFNAATTLLGDVQSMIAALKL